MLISYQEILESMAIEFTTVENLKSASEGTLSVTCIARAIDGTSRTYPGRFPGSYEPLVSPFLAWLMFVGKRLEEKELEKKALEASNEEDLERDGHDAEDQEGEAIVTRPFAKWLETWESAPSLSSRFHTQPTGPPSTAPQYTRSPTHSLVCL